MQKRTKHTSGFKTKVVLEALQERETIQEIGKKYEIHPNQISTWKTQFLSNASNVFEKGNAKEKSGDDYPLRIYIIFKYDPENAEHVKAKEII